MKKVLCLHGYSMNDGWLGEWIKPLAERVPDVEFIIPCAPIPAPEDEVRAMCRLFDMPISERRIGEGKNWCWYRASSDKPPVYQEIEQSLSMLAGIFEANPEIDGVLGWSQGTVMAAILAGLKLKAGDERFRFNWLVMCGGFRPGDLRFKSYFDAPMNIPSLHVIGAKETEFMREQGARLAKSFVDAETLITPVGHLMPVKSSEIMGKIASWVVRAGD